jgi:hypothetical protein
VGTTTVHRDLPLITSVPKWSGVEMAIPLHKFLFSIEGTAWVGIWEDSDKIQVATLKLRDISKQFYNGRSELHSADVTREKFKSVFRHRFWDIPLLPPLVMPP